jgi:phosphopantothenoylcysteine decarboxylase/phosphopantothenate--cysteine ligase
LATNLNGKRILITAGPTWAPIDTVRVISNTATGETGILLAKVLAKQGAKVTLILGPVGSCCVDKNIKVIGFKFFNELNSLLKKELKRKRYDAVIHSAAVSDYEPLSVAKKKLSSGVKILSLTFKPTPKIIDCLRKYSPDSFLVGFKFEPDLTGNKLIKEARSLIKRAHLDLAVANTAGKNGYRAWMVNVKTGLGPFSSKEELVKNLSALIKNAGN